MLRWILTIGLLLSLLHSSEAQQQVYARNDASLRGLVAWYLGTPGFVNSLKWYDLTGRFHGTLTNGPSWNASARPQGKFEIRFDRSNDYVTVASNTKLEPPARTVALWMKATAGGPDYQALVGFQHATHYFNLFYYGPGGKSLMVYFETNVGGNALDTLGGTNLPSSTWTHVAATYANGLLQTYVNCKFSQSLSYGSTLAVGNTALLIGASNSPIANYFGGAIDDIRIYDRALAASELCLIMRQSSPKASPNEAFPATEIAAIGKGLLNFFPTGTPE